MQNYASVHSRSQVHLTLVDFGQAKRWDKKVIVVMKIGWVIPNTLKRGATQQASGMHQNHDKRSAAPDEVTVATLEFCRPDWWLQASDRIMAAGARQQ